MVVLRSWALVLVVPGAAAAAPALQPAPASGGPASEAPAPASAAAPGSEAPAPASAAAPGSQAPAPASVAAPSSEAAAPASAPDAAAGLPAPLVAAPDSAAAPEAVPAEASAPTDAPEIVVRGRAENLLGVATSASQGAIGHADLKDRALLRRGELLETVPGMVVTQHSGDGKANQYFLRGFNLDHGTDFAFSVDGVPVNLPTHAHGQGYSDLNFMIPELVDYIEYRKGPFYAEVGDFSGSGATDIRLVNRLPQGTANVQGGMFGFWRGLVADSPKVGPGNLLYAAEYNHYDGPWDLAEDSNRFNGMLRYHWGGHGSQFTVTATGYAAPDWHATDQIPQRAVDAGQISRFGNVDDTDGGSTARGSLALAWTGSGDGSTTSVMLYGVYYRLNLFSNFTYFLDDPVNGDQFEQVDRRVVTGLQASHTRFDRLGDLNVEDTIGLQVRDDYIPEVALLHTARRHEIGVTSKDQVHEVAAGLYGKNKVQWTDWLRSEIGLRGDLYAIDVDSDTPANSGSKVAAIVDPKASLIFGPWARTELYLDAGQGFHSNDARGVTISVAGGEKQEKAPLLVHTTGAEAGVRTSIVPGLVSTVSGWYLASDSELTFAGDAGATEATGPSRKYGVEWSNFYKPTSWLTLTADLSLTHARYTDDPDNPYIANSIPAVATGGATVETPFGIYGNVRARYFGAQPLVEDDSAEAPSSTILDADLGYRHGWFDVSIEVFNLLDAEVNDIAYLYESRLKGEPAEGVTDVHFHPAEPLEARASLSIHY